MHPIDPWWYLVHFAVVLIPSRSVLVHHLPISPRIWTKLKTSEMGTKRERGIVVSFEWTGKEAGGEYRDKETWLISYNHASLQWS